MNNNEMPKCQMTRMAYGYDKRPFNPTMDSIKTLLTEFLSMNPHYKLQFEGIDNFIERVAANVRNGMCAKTYDEAERIVACTMEEINSMRWTFSRGSLFCPYWTLSEDEYRRLSDAVYEQTIKQLKQ